jgi:hypothetical protein
MDTTNAHMYTLHMPMKEIFFMFPKKMMSGIHFSCGRTGSEVEKRLVSPRPPRALRSGGTATLHGSLFLAICRILVAGGTARPTIQSIFPQIQMSKAHIRHDAGSEGIVVEHTDLVD